MQNKCVFCQIIKQPQSSLAKKQKILYEDELVLIMLDMDWAVAGHCLIIWKQHAVNLSDLSREEHRYFARMLWQAEKIILAITQKNKSLILKSGGIVDHLHYHIYPLDKDVSWEKIKQILDKKEKTNLTSTEKEDFYQELKQKFQKI